MVLKLDKQKVMDPVMNSEEKQTQRLEAFSDGVFAIAITLLILEIKVPGAEELKNEKLGSYLLHQWPKYFAYIFSFGVLGIYWTNHHYLYKLYRRTDHWFNMLNVLFLMTIAFLPFPSAILGEYIHEPEQFGTSVRFYALGIAMPAVVWLASWLYASHNKRLIDHRLSDDFIRLLTRQFILSNLLYLVAILLSFYYPGASLALIIFLNILYILPPKKPIYQ